MPAKKNTGKKRAKSTGTAGNKRKPKKQKAAAKKNTAKKITAKKHSSKKKKPQKTLRAEKRSSGGEKRPSARSASAGKRAVRNTKRTPGEVFPGARPRAHAAGQAGDLQGLSRREGADSESVDELLEEGNAFEAGVVTGVEAAEDADESEVHTHEVPEDDVPGEYLDKDS
jgi:hypothetical protein